MPKRPRRNKRLDAPHVRLYRWMLDCPAYLSLSCQARAVLLEIARGHDGTNNGRLGLSVRRASERCRIARGTAQRALVELQDRGFVDCMTKGAFSRKAPHATEWRLTWWGCDVTGELASKKFMSWGREKQNAVSKYPVAVSNQSHRAA
jgi:DNA-binding transcriptional regulator YhcF (GntR family)